MIKEINKMYFNQNDISFKVLKQFPAENNFFAELYFWFVYLCSCQCAQELRLELFIYLASRNGMKFMVVGIITCDACRTEDV